MAADWELVMNLHDAKRVGETRNAAKRLKRQRKKAKQAKQERLLAEQHRYGVEANRPEQP